MFHYKRLGTHPLILFLIALFGACNASRISAEQIAPDKFFFLHIPKTGGSTFKQLFLNHYHINNSMNGDKNPDFTDNAFLDEKFFLVKHIHYSQIQQVAKDKGWKLLTILRDPVQRALSQSRFKAKLHLFFPEVPSVLPPEEVEHNRCCRMLSTLNGDDADISIAEHLESAKKTLSEDMFFIAILERLEESTVLLCKKIGWTPPTEIIHQNTTEAWYQEYPQHVIDTVTQNNLADIELYQFALQLFEKQKEEILSLPHVEPKDPIWCTEIHYTFDQPLTMGQGWCERQKDNWKDGRDLSWFRWICYQEKASLDFPLKTGIDYQAVCRVCFTDPIKRKMRVYVNDHPVKYYLKDRNNRCQSLMVYIPQSYIYPNRITRLTFEIVDPSRPFQLDPYRGRCGFRSVDIEPIDLPIR